MAPATTVKMKAIERVKYGDNEETAEPGDTFETTPASADQLEELGHAERLSGAKPKDNTPTPPEPKSGKLPDDFPGKAALEAAGLTTYAQVRQAAEDDTLTDTSGIGDATADKIKAAL